MAITITKQKPKAAPALPKVEPLAYVDPAELTLEQLADKYGELEDRIEAIMMDPAFAQFDEVKKQLAERIKGEMEPTDVATLKGEKWLLEIGAAAKNNRKLKSGAVPLLQKILGAETFAAIAKVNISDVEKYCTPDQAAQVIVEDTGYSDKRKIVSKHIG